MPRYLKALQTLGKYALGIAGGVGILYGGRAAVNTLKGDPLAAFRAPKTSPYPDELGLRLTNVRVRRYVGKRVDTQFTVGQVDIQKNRQVFTLYRIHDGVYRPADDGSGEKGFRFAAGHGEYNGYASAMNLQDHVVLRGKEYDLASNALNYDGLQKTLKIDGSVRGTAWGGKVRAQHVAYDIDRKVFTSGPAMWAGRIPARYLAMAGLPANFQRSEWNVEAQSTKAEKNTNLVVYGDATLSDKEVIIKAPRVVLDKKTDTIVATGGVRYWSGKANFVGDKVTIIRKEKRAVLEGNVRMLVKPKAGENDPPKVEEIPAYKARTAEEVVAGKALPKPSDVEIVRSGKTVRDYPLVMVGSKVDYTYAKGSRVAIITGSPQARQELGEGAWRQVWTNTARYDAENEILRLNGTKGKGDARLKNSIGDDLTANWFELSTGEGDDEYTGEGIKGVVITTDDEDLPQNGKGGAGAGGTGTGSGGQSGPPPPTDGGKKTPPPTGLSGRRRP